jgi:hypothetical protein
MMLQPPPRELAWQRDLESRHVEAVRARRRRQVQELEARWREMERLRRRGEADTIIISGDTACSGLAVQVVTVTGGVVCPLCGRVCPGECLDKMTQGGYGRE